MLERENPKINGAFFKNLNAEDEELIRLRGFQHIRVIRSQLTAFKDWGLRAGSSVYLQDCHKLADLSGISTAEAEIETCSRLDLSTLAGKPRLKHLQLTKGKQEIENFDFIAGCHGLVRLTVTALQPAKNDFTGIINSRSLRFVWISPASRKTIREIGEGNKRIVLTNGYVTVVKGSYVESVDPYWTAAKPKAVPAIWA